MSECNHDCSNCSQSCSEENRPQFAQPHRLSNIRRTIAVVSGKGGVGKSLVTSLLAVNASRRGFKAAVLDADITGPSIPKMFGIHENATSNEESIFPCVSKKGVSVMSLNLLVENETEPVIWRGPVIAGAVTQFWTDVAWGDVDYMFVDMPPGTGDVPLTVFQSIPIEGIIIVSSPQELVSMIVQKAVKMAQMMNIPILGIIENMSYIKCPCCNEQIKMFGESHIDAVAEEYGIPVLAKMPLVPEIAAICDAGSIEDIEQEFIPAADAVFTD